MLVLTQNKEIVNIDHIIKIYTEQYSKDPTFYTVVARSVQNVPYILGSYSSEAHCQEVIREMLNTSYYIMPER